MRLAYLSRSRLPSREANSIHVMKMCRAFGALGHRVTLLAPAIQDGIEAGVADIHAFYGVEPTFEIEKLPWPSVKGRAFVYGWNAGRRAKSLAVDAAFGRCLYSCAVAARLGVPTVWDAHMLDFLRKPHERWIFKRLLAAPAFRGMLTNCESLRQAILADMPAIADRIRAAQNGADPVPDTARPAQLDAEPGRLQVGYVGHLYQGKGFEIVRALAALAPWADFHVVGGEQATVDALLADPALPKNLTLHGFRPPPEAQRLTLAFDIALAPYQARVGTAGGGETGAWMSPLKVFDYMAARRPIVCSDLPVLREVADPENALLVTADDPAAWLAALVRLRDDPALRARLAARAHSDFLARHTWQVRAGKAIEMLGAAQTGVRAA